MQKRYVIAFRRGVTPEEVDLYMQTINNNGGKVIRRFESIINGFKAELPEEFLENLRHERTIEYIEPEGVVTEPSNARK
ncbi:hypothetical protein CC2G_013967 [Coprinopsis cinerea AmutBmut pab1-1]|nr:hypothetical protein CC2G_013967 [Coprinopsis cinerea AmutBmut pab1-1]